MANKSTTSAHIAGAVVGQVVATAAVMVYHRLSKRHFDWRSFERERIAALRQWDEQQRSNA
jgi:hypothetical protein